MSSLIVEVCQVGNVIPHSNADALDIIEVKGWRIVVRKGSFSVGDLCVMFPPDSILSQEWTDRFGITKYCSPTKQYLDDKGNPRYRIRAARLRGEPSFGTVIPVPDRSWVLGLDCLPYYGVDKYEPPIRALDGDAERPHSAFHHYTDMENINNYPDILKDGEEVVVTEKIHGSNARVGLIRDTDESGESVFTLMVGSHTVRRKQFNAEGKQSKYWDFVSPGITTLLERLSQGQHNVVIFGEMYGAGVQDLAYGLVNQRDFRVFDIAVDMKYLDYDRFMEAMTIAEGVEWAPVLYKGPFSLAKVRELTDGKSTLTGADKQIREGVVVKPTVERMVGSSRVILKSISADYLSRKDGTEYH